MEDIKNLEIDSILSGEAYGTQQVVIARDDDGNPTVGFVIVGKDSPQYRETLSKQRTSGIRRQANKKTKIDLKTPEGAEEFDALMQANEFELACAVVVDWFGFNRGGKPMAFDAKVLRAMFEKKPSWREAVSQALEADEAFLKLSAANSSNLRVVSSVSTDAAKTA